MIVNHKTKDFIFVQLTLAEFGFLINTKISSTVYESGYYNEIGWGQIKDKYDLKELINQIKNFSELLNHLNKTKEGFEHVSEKISEITFPWTTRDKLK